MELQTLLQIGQLVALIVGAIVFIVFTKADVKIIKNQLEVMKLRQDSQSETLKQLTAILSTVAVQDNRLNNLEEDIRELKYGEKFISNGHTSSKRDPPKS